MEQNLDQTRELDQLLMAMAGHDLRKVVIAMGGVLNTYLQEVHGQCQHTGEASYIAKRATDMKQAGKDMLLCIDEILAALEKTGAANAALKSVAAHMDAHYPAEPVKPLYIAANGQYVRELTDLSANHWHM